MSRTFFVAAALALAVTLPAAPAQAQTRVFVSAAGSDSNNCLNTQTPCRHFQQAYNKMPNGGEIDVLDPANYGSLTVTHTLSIVGRGWATLSPVSGSAAITINAGSSDTISIIGVQLDGAGLTNTNGIVLNSGGSLVVADSVLRNFSGTSTFGCGILMQPSTGTLDFSITNTTVSNNGFVGIFYEPSSGSPNANGFIDHVVVTANGFQGINFFTGLASGGTTVFTVSNSIASDNLVGVIVSNSGSPTSTIKASIDNVSASGNSWGVQAFASANVLLSRSVITGNTTGVQNGTSSNTFYSFGNNQIGLNGTDGSSSLNKVTYVME
jgi:hypothetical protein